MQCVVCRCCRLLHVADVVSCLMLLFAIGVIAGRALSSLFGVVSCCCVAAALGDDCCCYFSCLLSVVCCC